MQEADEQCDSVSSEWSADVNVSQSVVLLQGPADLFLCFVCLAHKEVLRFRYEDYAKYVAEHNLIRVKALVDAECDSLPIMAVADIPLSMPELHIQVSMQQTSRAELIL